MDVAFKLVVKTPNQRVADLQVDCQWNWTVYKLKEHLSDVYPTKPESCSQKLIYSGQLLQDALKLGEVFDQQIDAHTVHIVCASGDEGQCSSSSVEKKATLPEGAASNQPDSQSTGGSNVNLPSSDGVRYRGTGPSQNMHSAETSSANVSYQPSLAQYMHQMTQYHMQNMMQYWSGGQSVMQAGNLQQWQAAMGAYQAYMNSAMYAGGQHPAFLAYQQTPQFYTGMPSTPSTPGAPYSPGFQMHPDSMPGVDNQVNEVDDQDMEGNNRQAQAPPPVGRNQRQQGIRMNAGGAMFEDDEDEEDGVQNRDWLDWIHTLLRAGVLFSIMYFYSTVSRLLLVCILGLIVYLYQAGYFSPRRNEARQEIGEQDGQDDNGNRINDDGDNAEHDLATEESPSASSDDQATIEPREPPPPGVLRILYSFVTSFFTSLIPTGPPPIQQP